jgi:hypothetical protein
MFDVLDHGLDRFDQCRNIVAANVEQLLGVYLKVSVGQNIPHSHRAAPLYARVAAQELALSLVVDILEFFPNRR